VGRRHRKRSSLAGVALRLGAVLVMASLAGCTSAVQTASTEPRDTASPTLAATPTPTLAPSPIPSPTGTFLATGDMTHPRAEATATLLADGRILISGGYDYIGIPIFQFLASAELYDPSTGTFAATGSMTTTRARATATLLADGRVLIMGGDGCVDSAKCTFGNWAGETALKSAEIYDPATGKFTPTGSMSEPRRFGSAMLLSDGRVLVVSPYSRLIEAYDPATGKFSRAGTLENEYSGVRAALLPIGTVLVVGNRLLDNNSMAGLGVELFDPESGQSSSILASLPPSVMFYGMQLAAPLQDGMVLIDLVDETWRVNYLITYDSSTGIFAQAGSFDSPAGWCPTTAVLLHGGRVLFFGGAVQQGADYVWTDVAGLYDPASGFGLLDSRMMQVRTYQMTVALPDGTALIAGGWAATLGPFSSAELFVP
jgi:hypothetical protein